MNLLKERLSSTVSLVIVTGVLHVLSALPTPLDIPPKSNSNINYKHNNTIIVNHIITLLMH